MGEPAPQASNLALAIVLLVVILLQAIFNAWQDFSTSRVMSSIRGMLPADVVVVRDGKQITVPAAGLVPGDLVHIALGQKVPADVKLIDVSGDLRFDRSVLTGEVRPGRAPSHIPHNPFHLFFGADLGALSLSERTGCRAPGKDERQHSRGVQGVLRGRRLLTFFFFFRRRTSHCKGRSASADLVSVSSSRSATTLYCASLLPSLSAASPKSVFTHSGRIAKLSSSAPMSLTTLQREILRFVVIIASLATCVAVLIVVVWAAW